MSKKVEKKLVDVKDKEIKKVPTKEPFKTTISAMDLGELNARMSKVNDKMFEAEVFKESLQYWQNTMLAKYGATKGTTYNIDFKTGNVVEVIK